MTAASIYLRKSGKFILPIGTGKPSWQGVGTIAKNLQSLGFGLCPALLDRLARLQNDFIAEWYKQILPTLKEMMGSHRSFSPMYPNFPKQVMDATEAELFFNAMTHYYGFILSDLLGDPNLVMLPHYEKEARPSLDEFHHLRWLDLGSEEDFNAIFTRLVASNGSLSDSDKDILRWFVDNRDVIALIPEQIPQKETLALLVAVLPNPERLISQIKTATDVLRVAVAMSKGDVSLAEPTKFRNFAKRERRFLLGCLEQCGSSMTEEMLRWKDRWIRLGERLHPGDFKNKFPKSLDAFDVLRHNLPYSKFNTGVEVAIRSGIATEAVHLLRQRPGDFARRLDHVLRTTDDPEVVAREFLACAEKVSIPVLLQMWRHFSTRNQVGLRAFFPKGNAAKVQVKEGGLPCLSGELTQLVATGIRQSLVKRFGSRMALGKVYIGQGLKDQIVPFSQRSASRSLRTVSRGSKFDLSAGDTVRFFCWWKNIGGDDNGRVDIDLSASLFDSDWNYQTDVAYYKLREGNCYHSGDITSAPNGACEFIDMNLPSVLEMKARYIVMSIMCFTGQSFIEMPECFGGWMMRQNPNSGEIFEARTVRDKVDITSTVRLCVPIIIDVEERKVYWADLGLKGRGQINNAARNSVGMSQIGRAIVELNKPNLFDLFLMHAEARGVIVDVKEDAETVFDVFEGAVTAFDSDKILSEYLS
ncbi:conserved hypothetical cytosolic protein [Pirellula staleyi DSM 6068]|uniref:Conserved hypothetical cytosolic protein n=1 Tax=Pirellula staleyi (strain ATCC 27377 / DSM 6068 / ICPB 4128) TaxID=530564 RepID=D2R5Y9_PIRSD|nr:TerD family protein [Pirellula staleyi]ADB19074.1 conserved hypothetical cytosolic protein [Pirellula staleyi DSM 6068]